MKIQMLFVLCHAVLSQSHYSLLPPFLITDKSHLEIGNWTLRDSAINMKDFIRLTPSYQYISGGVCQRVPVYSDDWSFEANVSTSNKYGGFGFHFYFTETLCTSDIFNVNGLAIWINTTNTTNDEEDVYFVNSKINSNENKPKQICKIKMQQKPFLFRITKRGTRITVDSSNDFENYTTCFDQNIKNLITKGYFSFFGSTTEQVNDHDLHGINIKLLSKYKEPENDTSSTYNRKLLDSFYLIRKKEKGARRSKMPKSFHFINKSKEKEYLLDKNPTDDIIDSFPIISESIQRAEYSISIYKIKKVFAPRIRMQLEKSTMMVDLAESLMPEVQDLLKDIWAEAELSLTEIAANISMEMEKIQNEATEYAKSLIRKEDDAQFLMNLIKGSTEEVNDFPSFVLIIICGIELFAYIVFFVYQRKKTMNFKKHS
ncbi:Legume-like lectin family protein [Tritrichomonas foetus]|uniref:Legume-like lectin family protein n=1 Tax=Tritrichomonas foetus TaxID=1144522 RepID=A0A1J4J5C8_9EUKA|nr:Legume-like lectin family protein [Tritrichomonas foetus]|eukprot:OHS94462.1 Legume-like lectin family protein [Tritrichomonas foetus]